VTLVPGVVLVNALLLAVGYALLAPFLRGRGASVVASYAGVALLVGAGLVGVTLFLVTIAGAAASPVALLLVSAVLGAIGIATAFLVKPQPVREVAPAPVGLVATAAAYGVAALSALALVGGFRSSPWLDDAWGIWLPKGVVLARDGLDTRVFAPNGTYLHFDVLDYPLWWSVLTGLDVRFVGSIDVRVMDAQLAILAVAFLAAAARLLSGTIRPWLLWPSLLLVAASPDFFRHAQGGMADLPLAVYVGLFAVACVAWLATGERLHLLLAFVGAATALALKSEGAPQVLLVLGVATGLGAIYARRRVPALIAVTAAAAATLVPWLVWRADHGIHDRLPLSDALDPTYLADRAGRIGPSASGVAERLLDPTNWLLLVPLAVALGLVGFVRERKAFWLAAPIVVGIGFVFWVWVYWASRDEVHFLVRTSAYRVVDALVLISALAVPLEAELLARGWAGSKLGFQQREPLREDRVLVREP
jgi:hypothetical protein